MHSFACDQSGCIFQVPPPGSWLLSHCPRPAQSRTPRCPLPTTSGNLGASQSDPETLTDGVAESLKHLEIGTGNSKSKAAIVMATVSVELWRPSSHSDPRPWSAPLCWSMHCVYYESAAQTGQIVKMVKKSPSTRVSINRELPQCHY